MLKLWGTMAGILLYMEVVYHFGCFGLSLANPAFALLLIAAIAGLQTGIIGSITKKRWKKLIFWIFLAGEYILVAAQMVYMNIFKQPLLWEAVFQGGQDALTNYWREALAGIWKTTPFLLLLAIPLIASGVLFWAKKWRLPQFHMMDKLRTALVTGTGIILAVAVIFIGKFVGADYYEDYTEFFDPLTVAEDMGVFTLAQRDTAVGITGLFASAWNTTFGRPGNNTHERTSNELIQAAAARDMEIGRVESIPPDTREGVPSEQDIVGPEPERLADTSPNVLPIDFARLLEEADTKETAWLAEYMQELKPTERNEFTGIFKDYNLIYLTAEGFSTYAVREDLTPTLYRLINSGFVFTNFYDPLWQTSTSDGEYINCTGLIPDGQFSMRKSAENDMAFSLPHYFDKEGTGSYAYHNNSLSYYDRHRTHPNLGYDFKAAKLGNLAEEQWGDKIFPMENPDSWPASDLEMMQGTVSEYLDLDRFNVYYMTVSGHMNYNFSGNAMSAKNKEAVAHLDMSENARAYIACHIELDKALEYLLEELEAAGKLENTVICMAADHYPYAMSKAEYEELAGKSLSKNLDVYRNSLILWNAGMEDAPVVVEKVCGSMDIIPTLLNLFGFDYDSRLYAGRDIFSEEEGMVIFNDRSFVTDTVFYNRKAKTTVWAADLEAEMAEGAEDDTEGSDDPGGTVSDGRASIVNGNTAASGSEPVKTRGINIAEPEEAAAKIVEGKRREVATKEEREQYMEEKKQDVKDRYNFSAYILRNDYYGKIRRALPGTEE